MTDLPAFGLFLGLLLLAVGLGEGLRAYAGWAPESSRRAVHACVGLATAFSPALFEEPGGIYLLAVLFLVANVVAAPRRWLPGMHGIERPSWGTATFPVALLVALGLCWSLDASRVFALQIAFGVLALADPAASLVGTRVAAPRGYRVGETDKSVAGTLAFGAVAAAVTALGLAWLRPGWGALAIGAAALSVAAVGAAAEALGRKGWDNLWIVLGAIVPLVHLDALGATGEVSITYLVGVGLAGGFGVAAYRARSLDLSGALAASILAWMVVALGGLAWAVPVFTFFVLSSALSRLGTRRKAEAEALAQKGSRRDAGQVVANGGVGAVLLAAHVFVGSPALYWGFVGAFAAAAADTWGTEIGTWRRGPTRVLAVGPRVPSGTSGGMSLAGTLGAALGASAVVASAVLAGADLGAGGLALVAAGGLAAAVLDSALGATVQARYLDPEGRLTERPTSATPAGAAVAHARVRGWAWVDNDAVNLACTAFGGLVPLALAPALGLV